VGFRKAGAWAIEQLKAHVMSNAERASAATRGGAGSQRSLFPVLPLPNPHATPERRSSLLVGGEIEANTLQILKAISSHHPGGTIGGHAAAKALRSSLSEATSPHRRSLVRAKFERNCLRLWSVATPHRRLRPRYIVYGR
jgi:hypothetical protein